MPRSRIHALLTAMGLGCVLLATGCASTTISGEGTRMEQVFTGNVGIRGEDHDIVMLPGSEVLKLSIMGEDVYVDVLDGATIDKIEIVGNDNEVVCPEEMSFEQSIIGEGNRIRRR